MTRFKNTNGVRLFGNSSASEASRPIIDTPSGPIYAGTEQAIQYLAGKAWIDPLTALHSTFGTMAFEKAKAVQDIAALLPLLPGSEAGPSSVRATLQDLSEALQGRVSDHVDYLGDHVARCKMGQDMAHQFAPRPPRGDETPAPVGQPLGTGYRERSV
jgi:hypothetical protein